MPPDRSLRPARPFDSKILGSARSLSGLHSRNDNTDGPDRLTAENISASPSGYAAMEHPATTNVSTSVAGYEFVVTPPLSHVWCSDDAPVTIDIRTLDLIRPQFSEVSQGTEFLMPPAQHHEGPPMRHSLQHAFGNLDPQVTEHYTSASITHWSTQLHPVQSANQHRSVDPQYHVPYHGYDHYSQYPPSEIALQPGALLEHQYSTSQLSHQPSNEALFRTQDTSPGLFNNASNFVIHHPTFVENGSDNFMASLLEQTIKGAEFDSSDPNMPLKCHRGTRLKIIKRCQDFILDRNSRKIRWVVGSAGVGKSAIMQSVARDEFHVLSGIIVGATIFFSINGRQDGSKAITTIAYQLAVKIDSYRRFIQHEVTRDPSLLHKSLSKQFNKFIVEPFIQQRILGSHSRLLIIIDGLDECASIPMQKELLALISFLCIAYPTSPIVWMIASRPEPHITSFFSEPKVTLAYEKEEILVDSDEACEDVKRYLRDKFREVQRASITLRSLSQWPSEDDFLKVACAAGGLFAYASTVVRYISDHDYGDPARLLNDVLEIIERGMTENIWGQNHPMAQLDALYAHIMSKIPSNVMADTRKILLLTISYNHCRWEGYSFQFVCNMLGMAENAAYGATHHIRSIAKVPGPVEAQEDRLEFFHKSFRDFLRDFERSGFSPNFESEAKQLLSRIVWRVLAQAPDGVYVSNSAERHLEFLEGTLKNGPGTGENITVSWPGRIDDDLELQFIMFTEALYALMDGLESGEEAVQSTLCIRALTTYFDKLPNDFPYNAIQDYAFDECRRSELLEHGILKQVLLDTLNYDAVDPSFGIQLRLRGLIVEHRNYGNCTCIYEREGSLEGHSWDQITSVFFKADLDCEYSCYHYVKQFTHHFKTRQPGHLVTVLRLDVTLRLVELWFVDPDDGVSDWTYHFYVGGDDEDDEEDNDNEDEDDEDDGGSSETENEES